MSFALISLLWSLSALNFAWPLVVIQSWEVSILHTLCSRYYAPNEASINWYKWRKEMKFLILLLFIIIYQWRYCMSFVYLSCFAHPLLLFKDVDYFRRWKFMRVFSFTSRNGKWNETKKESKIENKTAARTTMSFNDLEKFCVFMSSTYYTVNKVVEKNISHKRLILDDILLTG